MSQNDKKRHNSEMIEHGLNLGLTKRPKLCDADDKEQTKEETLQYEFLEVTSCVPDIKDGMSHVTEVIINDKKEEEEEDLIPIMSKMYNISNIMEGYFTAVYKLFPDYPFKRNELQARYKEIVSENNLRRDANVMKQFLLYIRTYVSVTPVT